MYNLHPTVMLIYALLCKLILLENIKVFILDVSPDEYRQEKGPCKSLRDIYGDQYLDFRGGKNADFDMMLAAIRSFGPAFMVAVGCHQDVSRGN